ncbi:MAG: VPLPA-CTERM-specific exosortase XrtD [Pseudomonadota bacterium]
MSAGTLSMERFSGAAQVLRSQGFLLFLFNVAIAAVVFQEGLLALVDGWQLAEYSHGPLIPLLSGLLFLRQLKTIPENDGPVADRWPGILIILGAVALALLGKFSRIPDIVAYAIIVWVAGILVTSFGWKVGRLFWPGVLHLVFMLPLPGTLYWKVSIFLREISSELGVQFVMMAGVPVFLDGNIIDLGVYKLHVADACSGLRYLFPIMSFSYIFATLYKGPTWHKAVLLLSAAPITVLMNSVRIGIIGVMVDNFGIEHAMGFSHFLEGWVIFITCVVILFGLAKLMLMMQRDTQMSLAEALDLETEGVAPQFARLRHIRLSPAFTTVTAIMAVTAAAWSFAPSRAAPQVDREPLGTFPLALGGWEQVSNRFLEPEIAEALAATDYVSASYMKPGGGPADVNLFIAWYEDQTRGGIHSPEVCLPAGGWEIAELSRPDISAAIGYHEPLPVNRAIIEKDGQQLLVYYWFEQYGGRTAVDYYAKIALLRDAIVLGRSDGALVRLTTPILRNEGVAKAEARMQDMLVGVMDRLPRFVPKLETAETR